MTQHPIVAFLLTRWDELEQKARAAGDETTTWPGAIDPEGEHIAAHDPAYVLADIAAKRRIVATFVEVDAHPNRLVYAFMQQQWVALRAVVAGLALPFAQHPEYKEAWRP